MFPLERLILTVVLAAASKLSLLLVLSKQEEDYRFRIVGLMLFVRSSPRPYFLAFSFSGFGRLTVSSSGDVSRFIGQWFKCVRPI